MTKEATLVSFKDLMQAKMEREQREVESVSLPKTDEVQNENGLDAQNKNLGRPKQEKLDAKTPKALFWTSKDSSDLDAKTPKNKNLDAQKTAKLKKWVKYEQQRSTDRLSLRPDVEILSKIRVYCAENNFTLTEFFEIAGLQMIDLDAQKQKNLDAKTPLDDRRLKMFYKTDNRIINLFREYNKIFNAQTDWKPKDDAVGVKYNDIDLRVIEIGIIQTQSNIIEGESETKPERFKYYTREIDKFISIGYSDQLLDAILLTNRKRWKEITGREIDLSFLDKDLDKE
jgi:hypothetical protein